MKRRELERKAEIAELLLDAARRLGETFEPDRVYDLFHELLTGVVQHEGLVVSSYDEGDGLIRCEFAWADGNRVDPSTLPPVPLNKRGGGMQSRVIVSGEPLLFNDVVERVQDPGGTFYDVNREGEVRRLPETGPPETRAAMMVPVTHEGRVVGVVQVMSDHVEYTEEQLQLVDGLVAQMGAAVRNARLLKERVQLEAAASAARAAADERERAAQVLDAVGDGIFLVDGDGSIGFWNRAAELVTEVDGATATGRAPGEVFTDWAVLSDRIPIAKRGDAARSVTLPVGVGDRELWLSFVAVRGADGVVYAFRDLTGERRLDEEKSELIATISHELRTPMAAVYGAAQTLLRPESELSAERRRQLVEMIVSQAARLSGVTDELLLASRLDRGDLTLDRDRVDVAALALSTADAIRQQVPPAIVLEVEASPDVPPAAADPSRLEQVLVNLLDNAVKYGAAPITLRVEGRDSGVRISVADSGPGIAPEEHERIFEKFYRSDPHQTRSPGGTGLGLYIARELVNRMGGRLGVRSQPGSGATFVVDLPAA